MATFKGTTVSSSGMAEILRQMRQYRATHGIDMPQSLIDSLIQGQAKVNADQATKRAAIAQDASQFDRALAQKSEQFDRQQKRLDNALNAGIVATGLKGAYTLGKKAWENPDIRGKIKDITGLGAPEPVGGGTWNPVPKTIKTQSNVMDEQARNEADLLKGQFNDLPSRADVSSVSDAMSKRLMDQQNLAEMESINQGMNQGGAQSLASPTRGLISPETAPAPGGADRLVSADGATIGAGDPGQDYSLMDQFTGGTPEGASSFAGEIAQPSTQEATLYGGQVDNAVSGGVSSDMTAGINPADAPTPQGFVPTDSTYDVNLGGDYIEAGGIDSAGGSMGGALGGGAWGGALRGATDLFTKGEVDPVGIADSGIAGAAGAYTGAEVGAALGSAGGPVGTVVGSVVGVVVSQILGGGRVICTELNRQGLIDPNVYALDQEYTRQNLDEDVIRGYLFWARPIANRMKRDPFLTKVVRPIAHAWAYTMAATMRPGEYKPRLAGRLMLKFGVPACRALGRYLRKREEVVAWTC